MKWLKYRFFYKKEFINSLFLSMLGSACLLFGLLCTLLKHAHSLWPIITAASCGFVLIWKWKKNGFVVSLCLLSAALWKVFPSQELLWPLLLSSSIALSWLVLFLGREEEIVGLREQNDMTACIECLKGQLNVCQVELTALESQIERIEEDKENWQIKHDRLSIEISSYQRKEKAFQHALEDAQGQLLKWKQDAAGRQEKSVSIDLWQAQEDPIELKSLQMLQVQHAQLTEQFKEKSEVLHQTRKELFALESVFLTLKKETEEKVHSEQDTVYMECIQQMQEECQDLDNQVLALQDIVSALLIEKKSIVLRKRKSKKDMQEDLFLMIQEKV